VPQGKYLDQQRSVATDQQPQCVEPADHPQVQQAYDHTGDHQPGSRNPSSQHARRVLAVQDQTDDLQGITHKWLSMSGKERQAQAAAASRRDPRHARAGLGWTIRAEAGNLTAAEHWYRQAIQARAEFAMVLLGRLLEDMGRLDEAETWLRAAHHSLSGEELVAFLERRGRTDEAKRERDRILAERRHSLEYDYGPAYAMAAPDLPTVITGVLISTAVLPFVQTLATKAAEGTYSAARALLTRLATKYAQTHRAAASALLIIEDPTHGLKLHLRTDETDEALQALSALEQTIKESSGRRGVKLAWDPVSKTWRTPPTQSIRRLLS
jgi:tetratricopeptide (TPR) repeat protein